MAATSLQLLVAEQHRLLEIAFRRNREYQEIGGCWAHLQSDWKAFELNQRAKSTHGYDLRVVFDPTANYVESKTDHTKSLVTLRVADDWLADVIALWRELRPNDDTYANHQYRLNAKKDNGRGSARKGVTLQVEFVAYPRRIEDQYELVFDAR